MFAWRRAGQGSHLPDRRAPVVAEMLLAIESAVLLVLAVWVAVAWATDRPTDASIAGAGMALLVGALALTPLAVASFGGRVDLTEPTVFAGWAVWFPLFGVGGVSLALRWSTPFYLDLVADPGRALMVAQAWGAVGFVAFAGGVRVVRDAEWLGTVARWLPQGSLGPDRRTALALWLMVAAGAAVTLGAVATGRLGYDTSGTGASSPALAYLAVLLPMASAMLWYRELLDPTAGRTRLARTGSILLLVNLACGATLGSRASLVTVVLTAGILTLLTRPELPRRVLAIGLLGCGGALFVGLLVVSSYRTVRYERVLEAQLSASTVPEGGQLDDLRTAFDQIGERGVGENLVYVRDRLVERLDLPGALGLVAERYPTLRAAEAEAGIDGNVVNGVIGAFVPRTLWSSKPATTDPNAIGRVYFEFDNAYAMSPMGEVLRDIGPSGVPFAMLAMGAIVGSVHTLLRGRGAVLDRVHPGRTVLWVVLLVRSPSWFEGLYATYLAELVRVGALGLAVLIVLQLVAPRTASDVAA